MYMYMYTCKCYLLGFAVRDWNKCTSLLFTCIQWEFLSHLHNFPLALDKFRLIHILFSEIWFCVCKTSEKQFCWKYYDLSNSCQYLNQPVELKIEILNIKSIPGLRLLCSRPFRKLFLSTFNINNAFLDCVFHFL